MKHRILISVVIDTDDYAQELTTFEQVSILADQIISGEELLPKTSETEHVFLDIGDLT